MAQSSKNNSSFNMCNKSSWWNIFGVSSRVAWRQLFVLYGNTIAAVELKGTIDVEI